MAVTGLVVVLELAGTVLKAGTHPIQQGHEDGGGLLGVEGGSSRIKIGHEENRCSSASVPVITDAESDCPGPRGVTKSTQHVIKWNYVNLNSKPL